MHSRQGPTYFKLFLKTYPKFCTKLKTARHFPQIKTSKLFDAEMPEIRSDKNCGATVETVSEPPISEFQFSVHNEAIAIFSSPIFLIKRKNCQTRLSITTKTNSQIISQRLTKLALDWVRFLWCSAAHTEAAHYSTMDQGY
jgi:hypothetical protein